MRPWVKLGVLVGLFLGSTGVIGAPSAHAQLTVVTPAPSLGDPAGQPLGQAAAPDELRHVLEQGLALEQDRRWGEALTLYEEALRTHPKAQELSQHHRLARIHYELGRRVSDASYQRAAQTMPERDALELYSEVLLKIHSHYVDAANWRQLVDESTMAFETALGDSVFVEHFLPNVPQARIDHFRRQLQPWVAKFTVDSRHTARDTIANVARVTASQLGLPATAVILEYACSSTVGLDSYSTFLTADQLDEVYSQIEGNFVGLGVELKADNGALLIVKVIPNSPAATSGIRAGDKITAVDGRPTAPLSTDEAANMLQGREGTVVEVTVETPGYQPRLLRVRRENVEIPSVDGIQMRAAGIGYLKLTCFQKTTPRDLDAALWQLHREGMQALVIDLRGNPGGLLSTSVEVADKFVDEGLIVSTRGRSVSEDLRYSGHQAGTWRMPIVVLIDGDSASASEIFAGAIQDHHRGTIVGTRSYGKGSVQGIFPLTRGGAGLRLTTAKFYSPQNRPYSGVGVAPDVEVRYTARPSEDGLVSQEAESDPVIDQAVRMLRGQTAQRQ